MDTKIFDSLLEPTFVVDQDGRVLYCNEPASVICQISVRKIIRSHPYISELFQFNEDVQALKDLNSIQDPSPYQEISFKTETGSSGRVQVTVQALPDSLWLVYFRDVTLEETLQRKYRAELEKKEHVIAALEDAQKKLEDYSRNLEKMVAERTAQLSRMNNQMKALLDSLGQGFLIFNAEGTCQEIASKACEVVLEIDPRGQPITEVLKFSANESNSFKRWMSTAFAEMLPFEDLTPLAPATFAHSEGRSINLAYYPIRDAANQIEGIVVVGTDVSDLVAAQKQAEADRAHAQMIIQLVQSRRQVLGFIRESEELVEEITAQLKKDTPDFELTFRALHTLKGGAASFSIQNMVDQIHLAEEKLGQWNEHKKSEDLSLLKQQSFAIQSSFQDFLKGTESILGSRAVELENREINIRDLKNFYDKVTAYPELKTLFFNQFLLEASGDVLAHFNDTIQVTASRVGKIVDPLVIENPEFRFWPEPYQRLISTFVHAFRNSVDHGIETPDQREQNGKNSSGRILIRSEKANHDKIRFLIADDGGGIDPAKIRARLEKKGFDCSKETDEQVIQHVFDAEFSTRDQVTDLSGRGVGMDAIRACAHELGGKVWVNSKLGVGTEFWMEVPWIDKMATTTKIAV